MATKVQQRKNPSGKIVYRAFYLSPDGDEWLTAGSHQSREEAQRAATLAEEAARGSNWVDPRKGRGTFTSFVQDVYFPANQVLEKSTQQANRNYTNKHLIPAFGDRQMSEIRPSDVQRWVSAWVDRGTHAPATVVKAHSILHKIFAWAVKDKVLPNNPCADTDLPTIPEPEVVILLPEECDAIWEKLPGLREKVLVLLASETGMRWSELIGFAPEQIKIGNRIQVDRALVEVVAKHNGGVRWVRKAYPKGKRRRTITISDECMTLLNSYIQETSGRWCICCPREGRSENQREIFVHAGGRHYGRTDFRRDIWQRALLAAGIDKPYTVKHLRSSFCSWMLAGNVPAIVVQELMGHKSIDTTEKYKQVLPEAEKAAATALQGLRAARRQAAAAS